MNDPETNIILKPKDYLMQVVYAILYLLMLILLVHYIEEKILIVLVSVNVIQFFLLYFYNNNLDISITFLTINFLPLVYLNNAFHYDFKWVLISSLPLILFVLHSLFFYINNTKSFEFSFSYIQRPLILFVIYIIILAISDFIQGKNSEMILFQVFHISLYLLIIPIAYLIKERSQYYFILKSLLFLSIVISIEYILFNEVIFNFRYVTFQSGFLPIVSGVVFAYFLHSKTFNRKTISLVILAVVVLGTFVTLTRTLWAITFLTLFLTFIVYLKLNNRFNFRLVIFLILISLLPFFFLSDVDSGRNAATTQTNTVEYRTKSLKNPLEDSSLLMRLEFSYYAIQRFIDSPIIGKGLGDYMQYKLLMFNNLPNYFIDNTWLYVLWKSGLIGITLFSLIYFRFFKTLYFIIQNTSNSTTKYICLGLFSGFISLSLLAFLSPLLIKYKTNVIIAFLFAYTEFEKNQILAERKLNLGK